MKTKEKEVFLTKRPKQMVKKWANELSKTAKKLEKQTKKRKKQKTRTNHSLKKKKKIGMKKTHFRDSVVSLVIK